MACTWDAPHYKTIFSGSQRQQLALNHGCRIQGKKLK